MTEPDDATPPITVTDDVAASRYEATVDGVLAFAQYVRRGAKIVFVHTLVPHAIAGRGVADALARRALDDARAAGLQVVPRCPFFEAFMRRHREYDDLRAPGARGDGGS
jgi:predicted GNAT family acetyltransferase